MSSVIVESEAWADVWIKQICSVLSFFFCEEEAKPDTAEHTATCQKEKSLHTTLSAQCMHNLKGEMFSNWQGLNILSYGNWIVSPLMEMCQTCSYTQQTADSEWRSARAREWDMDRRGGGESLSYYLLGCRDEDVTTRKNGWVTVALCCCHRAAFFLELFHFFSSNIYLMINPQLAPGRSEFCWLCSSS